MIDCVYDRNLDRDSQSRDNSIGQIFNNVRKTAEMSTSIWISNGIQFRAPYKRHATKLSWRANLLIYIHRDKAFAI